LNLHITQTTIRAVFPFSEAAVSAKVPSTVVTAVSAKVPSTVVTVDDGTVDERVVDEGAET